ncbi:MAG: hypothetical protein ABR975_11790 [Vulcanimicrobiaceae bacterium]
MSTSGSQNTTYTITNYGATVTFPSASVATSLNTTFSSTQPAGTATLQSIRRHSAAIGGSPTGLTYLCVTATATVTLSAFPSVALTVPAATPNAQNAYAAIDNPFAPGGWNVVEGPASVSGSTLTFSGSSPGPTLFAGQTYCFAFVTESAPIATSSPTLTGAGVPAWTSSQHTGYVAVAYGANEPQTIAIFAPGQTTPSATITYNNCCIFDLGFDSHGNLYAVTPSHGTMVFALGSTTPSSTLGGSGFSLALDPQNDIAVGGYNSGANVEVYPGGSAAAVYVVPGQPAFEGLAFSSAGELAVPQANGTIETFAAGTTTPNRTLPTDIIAPSEINDAIVAYDASGDLAVGSPVQGTIGIYAPGATSPSSTLNLSASWLSFDSLGRLYVAVGSAIDIIPAGATQTSQTVPLGSDYFAVDALGDIATATTTSWATYGANAVLAQGSVYGLAVAISP